MNILFTGYAPVHFKCFEPLMHRLIGEDNMMWVLMEGNEAIPTLDVDLWFVSHTTPKAFPRSYKKCIQIFHGMSFRNLNAREAGLGKDAYFLLGPHQRKLFESLGEDPERLYNVGFPKTDKLLSPEPRVEVENPDGLPVVLYAPTGARHNSMETGLGPACVNRLAETDEFRVLVKLHDHPKREIDAEWDPSVTILPPDFDVTLAMKAADLLITDASSVANEYLLLDRPIVFLDVPKLIDRAMTKGNFDAAGRMVGFVFRPEEGISIIDVVAAKLLLDTTLLMPRLRRREARNKLFYNAGHATDAAINVIQAL